MGVESRLREIHHSLSCLTPKLFTSAIFMTWGWAWDGSEGGCLDNEYSMDIISPLCLFGLKKL